MEKPKKKFDAVAMMREIRNQMSAEVAGMGVGPRLDTGGDLLFKGAAEDLPGLEGACAKQPRAVEAGAGEDDPQIDGPCRGGLVGERKGIVENTPCGGRMIGRWTGSTLIVSSAGAPPGLNRATKPSKSPRSVSWKAPGVVGKVDEIVCPAA